MLEGFGNQERDERGGHEVQVLLDWFERDRLQGGFELAVDFIMHPAQALRNSHCSPFLLTQKAKTAGAVIRKELLR